ncbi:MAG: tRNA pseudouridine(55) synthase TruB [Proteobacteria bacterium]|nr:tRNA pseudouridine(55) synthase TruB [Pseudomonadota bacterium]
MQDDLNGILVVDKPENTTSAKVVGVVKRLLGAAKVGHTGTLDPFATGVLICCVNRATKLSRFFLHGDKKYEAVLHLGLETDTQDATGIVTSVCDAIEFSDRTIRSVFNRFIGPAAQLPPVYSALKHKGVPLYKLARSGNPVQKPARRITILTVEILEIHLPLIRFEVFCSAGTYIRTLCADIGASLGCGGHLKELRRTETGGFSIADAVTLPELEKLAIGGKLTQRIIRMSDVLNHMPEYVAPGAMIEKIKHGHVITKQEIMPGEKGAAEGHIKIVDAQRKLVAVLKYTADNDRYTYGCNFNN